MKNIIVGTAGHIDHGKTTLIRALTGRNTDRWEEERRRGLTIDLGFAWTTLDGERLKVLLARPAKADGLAPGELRVEKRRVLAGTGDGTLELLTVQAPGKKAMAAPDWSRGLRDVTPRLI